MTDQQTIEVAISLERSTTVEEGLRMGNFKAVISAKKDWPLSFYADYWPECRIVRSDKDKARHISSIWLWEGRIDGHTYIRSFFMSNRVTENGALNVAFFFRLVHYYQPPHTCSSLLVVFLTMCFLSLPVPLLLFNFFIIIYYNNSNILKLFK